MNAQQFADKWRRSTLKESAAYQAHFEDVCRLVEHQTPTDADSSGGFFAYQRAVAKGAWRGRLPLTKAGVLESVDLLRRHTLRHTMTECSH